MTVAVAVENDRMLKSDIPARHIQSIGNPKTTSKRLVTQMILRCWLGKG